MAVIVVFMEAPLLIFSIILGFLLLFCWPSPVTRYRWKTALRAAWALYWLDQRQVNAFLKSYELFEKENVADISEGGQCIVDYYSVINYLCCLGDVEKMYIPPVMDENCGVFDNQLLWERQMFAAISAGRPRLKRILDLGCGRGRVAAHVSSLAGPECSITGLNIDPTQISLAREHAHHIGAQERLNFVQHDFNSLPLPFKDEEFDALYQVQVLTYATDRVALFKELYRILKPGARLCFLDYVLLDKFDNQNAAHVEMLPKMKALLGAVSDPSPVTYVSALEKAGFNVTLSKDASIGGHQSRLIQKADVYFLTLKAFVEWGCYFWLFPQFFTVLFERLSRHCDCFIEGDEKGLLTTSWQIIAIKEAKLHPQRQSSDEAADKQKQ